MSNRQPKLEEIPNRLTKLMKGIENLQTQSFPELQYSITSLRTRWNALRQDIETFELKSEEPVENVMDSVENALIKLEQIHARSIANEEDNSAE